MNHWEPNPAGTKSLLDKENRSASIFRQLKRIQDSHAFRNSPRSKQFLSYVIEHAVDGHTELLKERSIGVNLFERAPTYMTGEDPIVRVKAAEVRKRLIQYYAEEEPAPEVRIEIPLGSYVPEFRWSTRAQTLPPQSGTHAIPPSAAQVIPPPETQAIPPHAPPPKIKWKVVVIASVLAIVGIAVAIIIQNQVRQKSPLEEFWAPALTSQQPVLICLASGVTYYPSPDLVRKAEQSPDSPAKSEIGPLRLDPDTPLKWKDMEAHVDEDVAKDDAYVAADLSALLAELHKPSQVRIGRDFTFEDLRNSPVVLIGAFDNPWTIRMSSELPIVFRQQDFTIGEQGKQGRVWRTEAHNRGNKDFAIVARLLNSKTGQFLVILAGIGEVGTQATGEFVSREGYLEAALRAAPPGWQRKNLEMVLEVDVIDGSASPPRVVAFKTW